MGDYLNEKKKKWKEDLKNLIGLDYVVFKNVPMRQTSHGPIIDLEPGFGNFNRKRLD